MHKSPSPRRSFRAWISGKLGPGSAAFLATLMALPVNAGITLPTEPLTTSTRVPPNILFILDDSSSMTTNGGDTMANPAIPTISGAPGDITDNTYVGNTVTYDPAIAYEPWIQANGTPMTGGMTYGAAYSDISLASGTTTNLAGGVRTFYVPKDRTNASAAYLSNSANYYRYQILADTRVIRSEWLDRSGSASNYNNGLTGSGCTNTNNVAAWRMCTRVTPTGRSEAAELVNYATWYSYHRSRMKAAKAGSGRAFAALGGDVRVGFRTINASQSGTWFDIPVASNQGLFTDLPAQTAPAQPAITNRTTWYNRLYAAGSAAGTRYTPLRSALRDAGEYFSSSSATGPYSNGGGVDEAQYSCRQNFAILTTDGYWNRDTSGLSVGNADGTAGPNGYAVEAPYRDGSTASRSNTLADVAMHYWKSDLRTDLVNDVPTSEGNRAFWQHMVTFGISIGLQGNVDPEGPFPGQTGGLANWPDPEVGNSTDSPNETLGAARIDDLLHAAVNGRGSFLAAANPTEFAAGLKKALDDISDVTGSFSNVAANSTQLDAGTKIFQASYSSGAIKWVGELAAYNVTTTGTPPVSTIASTPAWRASQGIPAVGVRKVFTMNDAGTGGTTFPTNNQTAGLVRTLAPAVTGEDNAAYIKGDTTKEMRFTGGTLRNRTTSVLGAIVGSSPAYVKETDTIYVGASDGMLHAINAANGTEHFAYVPRGISLANLSSLSDPAYSHRFFVDGPMVVSTRAQTPNKNILVGALGKGGKGLFGLNVTSPSTFADALATNVLWDKSADDNAATTADNNLGLVQGRPIIAKLNNNTTAVIVGNGINSTGEKAVLFVYNLETGALIAEIDTGVGSAAAPNGLMAPVGWDADGNGTVDQVYAGDMLGNVWRFNLSATTPATWETAASRTRLFTAAYPGTPATAQPITSGLAVAMHPLTFKPWVFFGTGRLMTTGDIETLTVQSMYGIMDENVTVARNQLQQRTIVATGTGTNGQPVRGFEARAPMSTTTKGWYVDLLQPPSSSTLGERVVSDPQVVGDVLVFASVIPERNACRPDGRGYLNALDAFTGTSTGPAFFDLDGDGSFSDETVTVGGNTVPVGSVDTGVGMPTLPSLLNGMAVVGGSSGRRGGVMTRETRNVGRVSWREVIRN